MFRLIIILSLAAVALDLAAWQRIYRRWRRGGWLLALCLLDDMLPLAAVAAQVLLPDNTRGVVLALMIGLISFIQFKALGSDVEY